MALSGTEIVQVQAVLANGAPAAGTELVSTSAIAALAIVGQSQTSITTLNTVGSSTLTAANILTKVTARGGVQVAVFTDTTDTAANIIAAMGANASVGQSFKYVYDNNTVFPATLAGGVGVTISGNATLPAKSWGEYLVVYSGTNAVTITNLEMGYMPSTGTFTANTTTPVTVTNSNITANSQVLITLKTIGGTITLEPYLTSITPGTGFNVTSSGADTSVYNYTILG